MVNLKLNNIKWFTKLLKGKMGNELHALALTTEKKMDDVNKKIKVLLMIII